MIVHLVDGTYELFRHYFALPSHVDGHGREVGAIRGVLASIVSLLDEGATHIGVATDHVIESFRNDLYVGYKDGSGIEPALRTQFTLLEEVLSAAGFIVWPMVEYEADDALAAAARTAAADDRVDRVLICTPDKDLAQCVTHDGRVVQYDRRKRQRYDRAGVIDKFGVEPASIPDYLGLVGDSADGFPGLPGWGAKSAATVLGRYGRIEDVPLDPDRWDISVRGAAKLAKTLVEHFDEAVLFRRIATLETDVDVGTVDDLEWRGPRPGFADVAESIDADETRARIDALADRIG